MLYIFAGLIVIMVTNTLNGIDISPDFIGYSLIAAGLFKLKAYSEKFSSAIPWTIGLAVYFLFTCFYSFLGWLLPVSVIITLSLTALISQLIVFGIIAAGVKDMENINEVQLGSKKLNIAWKVITAATVLGFPLSYFTNYRIAIAISILLAGVNLVFRIVYVVYIKQTDTLIRNTNLQSFE